MDLNEVDGGICASGGISASGIWAGFRRNTSKRDLALVVADDVCTAAGVFTQNRFCAAPVTVSREHVANARARAIVLNSGNANAATGMPGLGTARLAAELVARELACDADDVLVASTGVIGVIVDPELFEEGIPKAASALSRDGGHDAALAIMTTDTRPKQSAVEFEHDGVTYHVGGMVKGSGMIMPNMATMLAVITTDASMSPDAARTVLKTAVDLSFNKVTVDSDSSTNDSCFLLATGAAGGATGEVGDALTDAVQEAVSYVCTSLARQVAADGEGSTKLVTVNVRGAASDADADLCARAIANSPLVKTAVAGHDANWGRVAAAAGKSGAVFDQHDVDIDILEIPVCRKGLALAFDEDEALKRFEADDIVIDVDLGAGQCSTTIWTCDLTHDYISINADYRS